MIAADNFARARNQQGVSKIVYISGSRFDIETVQRLENYGVPVEKTNTQIKRPHINVNYRCLNMMRKMMRMIFRKWTLSYLVDYFMKWLNDTRGTFMHTYQDNDRYIVYARKVLNHY